MRLRFLGTGTSHGVPVVGCSCAVCTSTDPRDSRYRCSAIVEGDGGEVVLIDAGPEFRVQALRARLSRLDAILVTHAHADHIHGLDDVRPLTRGKPLPVYASAPDIREIRARFAYAFMDSQAGGGKPRLELTEIAPDGVTIGSIKAIAVPLLHGTRRVFGYRIGGLAYLTDCSAIPESSMELLGDLDLLVIDALRLRSHPTHFSVDEAFRIALRLKPSALLLTHICHDLSHAQLEDHCARADLPFPTNPAWDGLEIDLP
ncbi:MAG: MBL fold metallo-hydrolase [Spirochaetae bacterium HGW-Spirochaetae-7]|jgi:phosphoribosyl 1,2-cyclic phosphate phosphodiesterase|nr:MAG: MBL fold metallo-hydrolase [Spirochaetae bacterium HGW-Spirochaetae-7]